MIKKKSAKASSAHFFKYRLYTPDSLQIEVLSPETDCRL